MPQKIACTWKGKKSQPHSSRCPGLVYHFIPLAENWARKWFKRCRGEARGIDLEDVLAEAVAMLPSIARTYKQAKGSVVAVVKPAVWRQLERKFGQTLRGESERLCAEVPEGEQAAGQERAALVSRVRAWATTKERRGLVEALDSGASLTAAEQQLIIELRAHMEAPVKTKGLWTVGRAAKYLRMPERQLRKECDRGEIPAIRGKGWCIARRDADALRQRKVMGKLIDGATTRSAGGRGTAWRLTKRLGRSRGPAPQHDRAEIMAALTDAQRAPHVWRNGYPCLSAVARWAGCPRTVVVRVLTQLTHC